MVWHFLGCIKVVRGKRQGQALSPVDIHLLLVSSPTEIFPQIVVQYPAFSQGLPKSYAYTCACLAESHAGPQLHKVQEVIDR